MARSGQSEAHNSNSQLAGPEDRLLKDSGFRSSGELHKEDAYHLDVCRCKRIFLKPPSREGTGRNGKLLTFWLPLALQENAFEPAGTGAARGDLGLPTRSADDLGKGTVGASRDLDAPAAPGELPQIYRNA